MENFPSPKIAKKILLLGMLLLVFSCGIYYGKQDCKQLRKDITGYVVLDSTYEHDGYVTEVYNVYTVEDSVVFKKPFFQTVREIKKMEYELDKIKQFRTDRH